MSSYGEIRMALMMARDAIDKALQSDVFSGDRAYLSTEDEKVFLTDKVAERERLARETEEVPGEDPDLVISKDNDGVNTPEGNREGPVKDPETQRREQKNEAIDQHGHHVAAEPEGGLDTSYGVGKNASPSTDRSTSGTAVESGSTSEQAVKPTPSKLGPASGDGKAGDNASDNRSDKGRSNR